MNKIYKVIWSKAKHTYVVASEIAKGHTKGETTGRGLKKLAAALLVAAALMGPNFVWAEEAVTIKVEPAPDGSAAVEVYTKDGAENAFATIENVSTIGHTVNTLSSELSTLSSLVNTLQSSTAKVDADGKVAKAVAADSAELATKAERDGAGNVIISTYATKTEVSQKADASAVTDEASAREAGDKTLNDRITAVKEYVLKETGDNYVSKADAAVQDAGVVKADKKIGENVTALGKGLYDETAARIGADKAQDAVIQQVNQNAANGIATLATAYNNEVASREAADTAINNKLAQDKTDTALHVTKDGNLIVGTKENQTVKDVKIRGQLTSGSVSTGNITATGDAKVAGKVEAEAVYDDTTKPGNYVVQTNSVGSNLSVLDTQVKANADAVATKANAADVYTKTETDSKVDAVKKEATTYTYRKVAAEEAARKAADNELNERITNEANAIHETTNQLQSDLSEEAKTRESKDNELNERITNEANAIHDEIKAGDTALDNRITAVKESLQQEAADTYVSKADAAVQDGAIVKADKTIGENVTNLDAALAKETADRLGADKAQDKVIQQVNQNMVDGFNTINKNMADGFTALNNADLKEAQERAAADTVLDDKITAETSARVVADTKLVEAVNSGLSLSNDNVLQKNTTTIDAQGNVTTSKTDANEMILNKGKDNQITLNENGIKVGTSSTVVDKDGVYTGGDTYSEAKTAMSADGKIKGANGAFTVDENGNVASKATITGETVTDGKGASMSNGTVTGKTLTDGIATITNGNINTSGSVTGGTVTSTGNISALGDIHAGGAITGASASIQGALTAGSATITGDLTAGGAIQGKSISDGTATMKNGNITGVKNLSAETITTSGDATIGGDLTVNGKLNVDEIDMNKNGIIVGDNRVEANTKVAAGEITSYKKATSQKDGSEKESAIDYDEKSTSTWAKATDADGNWKKSTLTVEGSDVTSKVVDSEKNSNLSTQTSTQSQSILTDKDKNTNVSTQTVSESSSVVSGKDGEKTYKSYITQNMKKILQGIKDGDGNVLTSTEQTETDITNTAANGTITNDAKALVNKASDSITSQIGDGSEVKSVMDANGIANTATGGTISNSAANISNTTTGNMTNTVGGNLIDTIMGTSTTTVTGKVTEDYKSDLSTKVGGDETHAVTGNQTTTVSGNRTVNVKGTETENFNAQVTNVKTDQKTSVGGNQTNIVGGDQQNTVSGSKTETVKGSVTEKYGSQATTVNGDQSTNIGGNQTTVVAKDQTNTVSGKKTETVKGAVNETYGSQTTKVNGDQSTTVTGKQTNSITGDQVNTIGGNQTTAVTGDSSLSAKNITNTASETLSNSAKNITNTAAEKLSNSAAEIENSASKSITDKVGDNVSRTMTTSQIKESVVDGANSNTSTKTGSKDMNIVTDGTSTSTLSQLANSVNTSLKEVKEVDGEEKTTKSLSNVKTVSEDTTKITDTTSGAFSSSSQKADSITSAVKNENGSNVATDKALSSESKLTSGSSVIDVLKSLDDAANPAITSSVTDGTNNSEVKQTASEVATSAKDISNTATDKIISQIGDGSAVKSEMTADGITNTAKGGTIYNKSKDILNEASGDIINWADGEIGNVATKITNITGDNTVTSDTNGTTFENKAHSKAIEEGSVTKTTISGNTLETGKATMDYAEVMKDLGVHGNATVDGNTTLGTDGNDTLTVNSTSTFKEKVTMEKDLKVKSEVLVNEGDKNQVRINTNGITVGLNSTVVDSEGVYVGGHTFEAAKAGMDKDGKLKAASGKFQVDTEGNVSAVSYTVKDTNIKIDNTGINAGGTKVTGLDPADISHAGSTDAVSGGQLYETNTRVSGLETRMGTVETRVDKLDNKIDKVGANAAAMANLHPLEFDEDSKWNVAAAVGSSGSETASAVGVFYRPNENVMVNASAAMGTGENMFGGGVSLRLGHGGNKAKEAQMKAAAAENKELRAKVDDLTARMDALLSVLNPNMSKDFPDVPENHWAYEAVSRLAGNGIVEGYEDGKYHGERQMTRYEMAEIIYNALSKGAKAEKKLVEEFRPELQAMAAQKKA